jgi:hypothetical protein
MSSTRYCTYMYILTFNRRNLCFKWNKTVMRYMHVWILDKWTRIILWFTVWYYCNIKENKSIYSKNFMFDQTLIPTWKFKGKNGNFPGTNVHKIFVKRMDNIFWCTVYTVGVIKNAPSAVNFAILYMYGKVISN